MPFPVFTYEEAHRAVRLGQAGHPLRDGAGRPRAGAGRAGRHAVVGVRRLRRRPRGGRPGQGDRRARDGRHHPPRDRRADRARPPVRREGPRPPRARGRRRDQEPDRQVPVATTRSARSSSRPRRSEGDLILDRRRRAGGHRRRPRPAARRARRPARPGRPERAVPTSGSIASRCTSGTPRAAAGTPPTTRSAASCPRTRSCSSTASGDPARAVAGRPGRPRPGAPVRPRAQRLGARRRVDPDPPPRPPRALVPAPGPLARGDAREVRRGPRRLRVRRAAARRDRARHRPLGRAARPPDEHPRGDGLPEDPVGHRPDARGAVDPGAGAVRGARPALRRRRGRPRPERGHPRATLGPLDWFAQRPRLAALLGAMCIAFSGIFYLFAAVSPSTGTFYRAVFGLPLLVLVALGERRRHGPLPRRRSASRRSPASSSPAT